MKVFQDQRDGKDDGGQNDFFKAQLFAFVVAAVVVVVAAVAMFVFVVMLVLVFMAMFMVVFVLVVMFVFHNYSPTCSRPWLRIDVTCESASE